MKKLIHSIIVLMLSATVFAQAPQSFKYQAVARDASGEVMANEQVNFQFSILEGSSSGTAVYIEQHTDTTNQFGLVNLEIGNGSVFSGDFPSIDWGNNTYFLKVELNGVHIGTSQLLSVPYALHAKTAANTFSGDYSDLTNKPVIPDTLKKLVTDAGNKSITNLANPINAQDAATKTYVDALEDRLFYLEFNAGKDTIADYDGNYYKIVKIGYQYWMAENLKTTKFNDGTDIPLVTDNTAWSNLTTPGYCWYYNDSATNETPFGALYNWCTIEYNKNLCPTGWHVPTNTDWITLIDYLGGESIAGGKLKETGTTHWNSPNTGATNEIGFTGLPGGRREWHGAFGAKGLTGSYWSSSEHSSDIGGWFLLLNSNREDIKKYFYNSLNGGFSVRCIKDE